MKSDKRALTAQEIQLVSAVLSQERDARDEFDVTASLYKVSILDKFGSLRFWEGPDQPRQADLSGAVGVATAKVEGSTDPDDSIELLVFYSRGVITELQIYTLNGKGLERPVTANQIVKVGY
ncbi:hypothetical protein [uncultured Devosia sp.]|uniref:hypothetical protein n=1 Tax=uncultured Devosia sp. TaxID=211434 RepID=UPI0035CB4E95